ncbi:MAG: O-antigen ligase family protein [Oscillospiraceae bacterium]|nr:O-antigen ligase family protein [Oscillospiraceae bacterium]
MPKTIFHTTERSNFILNMKTEEFYRFNLKVLLSFVILMPLFSSVLEFAKVYSVPGMALAISGVFAMVFTFIGFMKQVTPRSLFIPGGILAAMVAWSVVSLYNSYDYKISLFGADGRSEGVFALVFYGCFFMLGAQLGTDDNRRKLLHGMLWLGLAECAWSLLQMLPLGFPSYYSDLEPALIFRVFLPSGLTGSPIFLALMLVMLLYPAMLGAFFSEDKKARIFYTTCSACFALTAIKTQCLVGVSGAVLVVMGACLYALMHKAPGHAFARVASALAAIVVGVIWICISPAINSTYLNGDSENTVSSGFALYDGGIMWKDSAYRLEGSGYYINEGSTNPEGSFDIASIPDTYRFEWRIAGKIIGRFPLVGSGPDNLVYPQLYRSRVPAGNVNTFDRCYNTYLHLAATMGVPMLVLYLALLFFVVRRGRRHGDSWLHAGVFGAVIASLLMQLVAVGSITCTPLFWMLAGVCISLETPKEQ